MGIQNQRDCLQIIVFTVLITAILPLSSGLAKVKPIEINGCTEITQPGSYVLAGDISLGEGRTCISVYAHDVKLNCARHKILGRIGAGEEVTRTIGVYIEKAYNARVEGCDILNFNVGIQSEYSTDAKLVNNRVEIEPGKDVDKYSYYYGIVMANPFGFVVESNTIDNIGREGIYISDVQAGVKNMIVANNTISDCPLGLSIEKSGAVINITQNRFFDTGSCIKLVDVKNLRINDNLLLCNLYIYFKGNESFEYNDLSLNEFETNSCTDILLRMVLPEDTLINDPGFGDTFKINPIRYVNVAGGAPERGDCIKGTPVLQFKYYPDEGEGKAVLRAVHEDGWALGDYLIHVEKKSILGRWSDQGYISLTSAKYGMLGFAPKTKEELKNLLNTRITLVGNRFFNEVSRGIERVDIPNNMYVDRCMPIYPTIPGPADAKLDVFIYVVNQKGMFPNGFWYDVVLNEVIDADAVEDSKKSDFGLLSVEPFKSNRDKFNFWLYVDETDTSVGACTANLLLWDGTYRGFRDESDSQKEGGAGPSVPPSAEDNFEKAGNLLKSDKLRSKLMIFKDAVDAMESCSEFLQGTMKDEYTRALDEIVGTLKELNGRYKEEDTNLELVKKAEEGVTAREDIGKAREIVARRIRELLGELESVDREIDNALNTISATFTQVAKEVFAKLMENMPEFKCPRDREVFLIPSRFGATSQNYVAKIDSSGGVEKLPESTEDIEVLGKVRTLYTYERAMISIPEARGFIKPVVHEFGHLMGLRDEYDYSKVYDKNELAVEASRGEVERNPTKYGFPNCAISKELAMEWWGPMIKDPEKPPGEGEQTLGYYNGCTYSSKYVRPTYNSIMKNAFAINKSGWETGFGPWNIEVMRALLSKYRA